MELDAYNWAAIKVLWDVLQGFLVAGVAIYAWWTNKHRATGTAIRDVNHRIDALDRHVTSIEQTVGNQPDYGDLDKLRAEMAQTNRGLAEVSAQLQGTSALLNRLHDYLLQERGNR